MSNVATPTTEAKPVETGGLKVVQLRKFRNLFASEEGYREIVAMLHKSMSHGSLAILLDDEEVVAGVVSPLSVRETLRKRIVSRLTQNPDGLRVLEERLGDDRLVKYGEFE